MGGPVDLTLTDGDLDVTAGEASLVDGAEQVAQALETHLNMSRGEWFMDRAFGVPYYQSILGARMIDKSVFDSIIKAEILVVDGVNRILSYASAFDRPAREYSVSFTVDTIYGPITYEGALP